MKFIYEPMLTKKERENRRLIVLSRYLFEYADDDMKVALSLTCKIFFVMLVHMIIIDNNREIVRKLLIKYPFLYRSLTGICRISSNSKDRYCDDVIQLEREMTGRLVWPSLVRDRAQWFLNYNLCKLSYIYNLDFPLIFNDVRYRLYAKIRLMELKLGPDKVGKQFDYKNIKLDDDPETLFKYRCYMGNIEETKGNVTKIKSLLRWLIKGNKAEQLLIALIKKSNEKPIFKKKYKTRPKLLTFMVNYSIKKICMYNKCTNILDILISLGENLHPVCFVWCIFHNNRETFRLLLDYCESEVIVKTLCYYFNDLDLVKPFLEIISEKYQVSLTCDTRLCNNYFIEFLVSGAPIVV